MKNPNEIIEVNKTECEERKNPEKRQIFAYLFMKTNKTAKTYLINSMFAIIIFSMYKSKGKRLDRTERISGHLKVPVRKYRNFVIFVQHLIYAYRVEALQKAIKY